MKSKTYILLVSALIMILAFPNRVYAKDSFFDKRIHKAYISGYPDGTIRPERYVTREEAASMFYRLLDDDTEKDKKTFNDVDENRWSYEAIGTLGVLGIINGEEGFFRPEDRITRAEMAVIISKFADLDKGWHTFNDVKGHWAENAISSAVSYGWMAGYTDGEFRPNGHITRAEMTFFINNALGRGTDKTDNMHAEMKVWKDNTDTDKWYYFAMQEASNSHEYIISENTDEVWKAIV